MNAGERDENQFTCVSRRSSAADPEAITRVVRPPPSIGASVTSPHKTIS
jgi:hypothetical protein